MFEADMPVTVPVYGVNRQCASGLQAIASIADSVHRSCSSPYTYSCSYPYSCLCSLLARHLALLLAFLLHLLVVFSYIFSLISRCSVLANLYSVS
jgi:hypothetical protein